MSIIVDKVDPSTGRYVKDSAQVLRPGKEDTLSSYVPSTEARDVINSILKDFRLGWQTMHLPRPEFNDLSLYQRHIVDMLAFNTYQENDGNPMQQDRLGGWRSQAIRPVVRNKAISIAAHLTARLTVPKIFAYDEDSEEQEDAAKVMSYLVDWAREQANYTHEELYRVLTALYSPISWGYTEYAEVYRTVKKDRGSDGKWTLDTILDEQLSGHKHYPVATDQVFFSNFYERNPQKQDFIIMRRIISYDLAKQKYGANPDFKYVHPGIIVTLDDTNSSFYHVYDPHMQGEDVEEVIRWRKNGADFELDSRHVMINGVLLSEPDAANPRLDHQYPFDCFYYLPINERCIAGKSLVSAMQSDANILNTLYQMIIDGTFLNLFPPTVTKGSDKVGSDVIVPGLNLAFAETDIEITPLRTADGQSLRSAMDTLGKVESSIAESSQDPVQQGQNPGTPSTAYEISRIEQNAATVLGLTMKLIGQHAINFGNLLVSDILQYQTIASVTEITGDNGLVYKTFYAKEPGQAGKTNKIKFDANLPDSLTDEQKMELSYELLKAQGGIKSDMRLWKVNPVKFREFKYEWTVDEDVLNPRSADLLRAMDLETYDRAIANPVADQTRIFKDLLMSTNPKTARDPDRYVQPPQPPAPPPGQAPPNPLQGNTVNPASLSTNQQPIPSSMGKVPIATG